MPIPIETIVAFTFSDGLIESVRIADGWSESVPVDHFGTAVIASFTAQFQKELLPATSSVPRGHLSIPASVADDLAGRAIAITERAWDLLADLSHLLADGEQEPPVSYSDLDRHVVVKAQDAQLARITVSPRWLSSDPVRVEKDLRIALNKFLSAASSDSPGNRLTALRREHLELNLIVNEYRELP